VPFKTAILSRLRVGVISIPCVFLCTGLTRSETREVVVQQTESEARLQEQNDRAAVVAAIQNTLSQGTGTTASGVKFSTYIPPSQESVATLRSLGDRAIPILAEYLVSKDDRESRVAMRLLASLGGARVVPPLAEVARTYPAPRRRILALKWLSSVPSELTLSVFRDSAEHDPDPNVGREAKELLAKSLPQ
jgi:hypothetical protein